MAKSTPVTEAAQTTADAPPPPSPRKGGGLRLLFLFLALEAALLGGIGVAIYAKREWVLSRISASLPAQTAPDFSGYEARLTVLEQQVQTLAQQPAVASADTTPRLAQIDADIAMLKQSLAVSPQDVQSLRDQLQQLTLLQQGLSQQVQSVRSLPDLRLVALFQSLRSKALEGTAFQEPLQRFLAQTQPHPLLRETALKLEEYASTGRPRLPDMQRGFSDTVKEYLLNKNGTDNSLSGKIRRNLAQFITVRRLDDRGNSSIATINRAEQAVMAGQLEEAETQLADLPPDVQPYFAAWRAEAKAYYQIPALLQQLDQRLAETLMQPENPQ